MVIDQTSIFMENDHSFYLKLLIILCSLIFLALLLSTFLYPLLKSKEKHVSIQVHKETPETVIQKLPSYKVIALAMDFSERDNLLLVNAIKQADKDSVIVVIHIVESASAKILGNDADDLESRKDQEKLDKYVKFLEEKGFRSESRIGFRNRHKEIPRLVKEVNAELLIIGSHGHKGVKDWLYGETINTVRHQLRIPVLIIA
jgi:Universal stress protein UspA and related nucleotide-binding proteins